MRSLRAVQVQAARTGIGCDVRKGLRQASDLRRNHPRLIPEVAPLAMNTLERMGFVQDVVISDDDVGYPIFTGAGRPSGRGFYRKMAGAHSSASSEAASKGVEVFGNLSLTHGLLKIKTKSTPVPNARQGGLVVGGLGFTHDPVDQKVRIFELIGIDDTVRGSLLSRAERIATEELNALLRGGRCQCLFSRNPAYP